MPPFDGQPPTRNLGNRRVGMVGLNNRQSFDLKRQVRQKFCVANFKAVSLYVLIELTLDEFRQMPFEKERSNNDYPKENSRRRQGPFQDFNEHLETSIERIQGN